MGNILSEQKNIKGERGKFLKKTEALHAEPNERAEAATIGYSATGDFFNIFILHL